MANNPLARKNTIHENPSVTQLHLLKTKKYNSLSKNLQELEEIHIISFPL